MSDLDSDRLKQVTEQLQKLQALLGDLEQRIPLAADDPVRRAKLIHDRENVEQEYKRVRAAYESLAGKGTTASVDALQQIASERTPVESARESSVSVSHGHGIAIGDNPTVNIYYGTQGSEHTSSSQPAVATPQGTVARAPLTVFLCHGKEDKPAVIALYDELTKAGVKPWLDVKDLVPGQRWRRTTIKAVRESDVVVVCLTRSSMSREGFLQTEIAEALDVAEERPVDAITVIPLRLEDCGVPERLQEYHWVDFFVEDRRGDLMRALRIKAAELGRQKLIDASLSITAPIAPPDSPASAPVIKANDEQLRLIAVMSNTGLSLHDRAAAGRRLSEIGDPRLGVGLRADGLPDIVWCDIPAGAFLFSDPAKPTKSNAFRIAKYPVTFAQFQAFVNAADGFTNPIWWRGLHEKGLEQKRSGPGEQAFKFSNHPCENVSWYDAMAFCAWLSSKPGYAGVRLTTELEWERAARGTDGRVYPWGDEFDPWRANADVGEIRVGETSAVAMFPNGVSPYGVFDMSGNVWEWTSTVFVNPDEADAGSKARRILRGGSWGLSSDRARADYRFYVDPVFRSDYVGFRLAAAPAMSSTLKL